ncbi:hypothetical protein H0R92_06245 [Treponema sp. OMZ 840]|uniref:hypothetical protein n=1 Tax=Treponema sp. OMZ 840 TaxID=244313 RepID=UPI003D8ACF1C
MFGSVDEFIGQATVLLLLLPVVLRPLFKKRKHADSTVMLSPLSFVLSLLLIVVYGLSYMHILTASLSLLVLLTNVRALQRFNSQLYVDYYSLTFRIAAFFETLCILFACIILYFFHPAGTMTNAVKTLYTGSFNRGFSQRQEFFRPINAITTAYLPADYQSLSDAGKNGFTQKKPLVVFLPDTKNVSNDSSLRLSAAAEKGIPVLTGDFYKSRVPDREAHGTFLLDYFQTKAFFTRRLHKNEAAYKTLRAHLIRQKQAELEALLIIAGNDASSVVVVTEGDALTCAKALYLKYPDFICGIFDASELKGIIMPRSFSQTQESAPLSADEREAAAFYASGTADLISIHPFDAFVLGRKDVRQIKDFFAIRRLEKTRRSHIVFAQKLQSYIEELQ